MREPPVLELSGVVKDYRSLRPLRITQLAVRAGERVAIAGFDLAAAEVLVNLITGAALPDAGTVTLFGRDTAAIADSADWLRTVDRFGIVSPRTVLLDTLSVAQNLALPFSIDIEPLAPELRSRAVAAGLEAGLQADLADQPAATLAGGDRYALRLGRALALDPDILLLEHPTAELAGEDTERIGRHTRGVLERRSAAGLALTSDAGFARGFSGGLFHWNAAKGTIGGEAGWLTRFRTRP